MKATLSASSPAHPPLPGARHVTRRAGGVGMPHLLQIHSRFDEKEEAAAKGMSRAHEVADIAGLADILDPDAEKATHQPWL